MPYVWKNTIVMMKNEATVPPRLFTFKFIFAALHYNGRGKFSFNDLMHCVIESSSCLQRYLQMCLKMHAA